MKKNPSILYLILIFSLCTNIYPATWHQIPYGQWTVVDFSNTPFPTDNQTSPDPAFQDSSVYIFVPKSYINKPHVDLIIEHHGHGAIIDPLNTEEPSYVEDYRQDYQLYESRKNAILVMPQAARNKSSSDPGRFVQSGMYEKFVDELVLFLKNENIIDSTTALGSIHLNSFSGGYWITSCAIKYNRPEFISHVRSIQLWDSFYGQEDTYFKWVFEHKGIFYNIYTTDGGTCHLSRSMLDSLRHTTIPFDTVWNCTGSSTSIHIELTHRWHSDVARGEFTYARHLINLPLDDIGLNRPELLSAIPGKNGIIISWFASQNQFHRGFKLLASPANGQWQILADETVLSANSNSFFHAARNKWKYKLQAVGPKGEIQSAAVELAASCSGDTPLILLVHAENRRLLKSVRGFDPDSFLYKPDRALIQVTAGFLDQPFASCTNMVIRAGTISPDSYKYIFWLSGNEEITDKIADHAEQAWLKSVLQNGGNIIFVGKGLPIDLASDITTDRDRNFGTQILGIGSIDTVKQMDSTLIFLPPLRRSTFKDILNSNSSNVSHYSFKYATKPVIVTASGKVIATISKRFYPSSDTGTSTTSGHQLHATPASTVFTLTVPFELIPEELSNKIIRSFFDLCKQKFNTSAPPVLPTDLVFSAHGLSASWDLETEKIIVSYFSENKKVSAIDTCTMQNLKINFSTTQPVFLRVQPLNGQLPGVQSELLGCSTLPDTRKRWLIVNGFDRATAANSHDFVAEHGMVLNMLNYNFDSATNEAVVQGKIKLQDYDGVDWLLGEESTSDETFSATEQKSVTDYLQNGGRLLVSGSEIGWDLVEKASTSGDSLFFTRTFASQYGGDDAQSQAILVRMENQTDTVTFGMPGQKLYPDIVNPLGDTDLLLEYDNHQGAAAGKVFPNGSRVVYVAFPLESILDTKNRIKIFIKLISYLFPEN